MRTTIIALSVMLLSVPAAASDTAKDGASNTAAASGAKERKFCIQYEDITGSRTAAKMECKTKAQWARQGVKVDQLSKD